MRSLAIVVACLACIGLGRRVLSQKQGSDVESVEPLAKLLMSLNPASAFNVNPSGQGLPLPKSTFASAPSLPAGWNSQFRLGRSPEMIKIGKDDDEEVDPEIAEMMKVFNEGTEEERNQFLGIKTEEMIAAEEAAAEAKAMAEDEEPEKTRGWKYDKKFPPTPRMLANKREVESRPYEPDEAVSLMKRLANAKFTETAEVHARLRLDPKYNDQNIRTTISLPFGTGNSVRVAVLADGALAEEAEKAGADVVGFDDLVEDISAGKLDFEILIATPPAMPKIAKLGKVLGPRGLMPSPKQGTVTTKVAETVQEFKAGKFEIRLDKTGIMHIPFGKVDFEDEKLMLNLKHAIQSIERNKPKGAKGKYWRSAYVASTMGPGIKLDMETIKQWTKSV